MKHFFIFLLCLFSLPAVTFTQERIKVGVSTALTGDASTYGTDIRNAIEFANEKIADGKYELIFEDDQCSGKAAATIAQKLVNVDKVKYVLGQACSTALLASAPIYEKAGVLVISPSASAKSISDAGDYIFRTWPSDAKSVEVLYNYAQDNHKAFGIISEETDYAQGFLGSFLDLNKNSTLRVFNENFLTSDKDYRSIFLKLQQKGIDGLFLNTQSERTFLALLRQFKELKMDLPIYGAYWPASPVFREQAGQLAEGIIYVDAPSAERVLNDEGKTLLAEYIQRYGRPQYSEILFATTLEAFRSMHLAIVSGKEPRDFLYHQKYEGIMGEYSFDRNGDILGLPFSLKQIQDGKTKIIG